jgi:long-subunit fatty acid transport protein
MSHCALLRRLVALSFRSWARLSALLLALLPPRPAAGQIFQDEIDLAGRTTLTLGAGARAYGMGGSFLARADDATAASWNPAGLSYLRVPELSLVGNYNVFHSTIGIEAGRAESDELRGGTVVDFGSFTWPIRIGGSQGSVQVNYQRTVPFDGSRTIRTDDPLGERSATGVSDGGYDVLAFGTGLKVTRQLRVGATLNRWFNGYTAGLERIVPSGARPRRVLAQEFHLSGWNSNLGFMYSPVDQVNVAAVFKTAFTGKVELTKMRTDYYADTETGASLGTTRNAFSSTNVRIDFPWSLGFGVSWRPRSQLTLSADYTKTNWSQSIIRNYFTLTATPLKTPDQPPPPTFYASLPYPYVFLQSQNQSQNDSEEIRAGVEYVVIRESLKVPLRAGYFNDKQINIFGVESAPRFNGFTVGTGVILGPVVFDVAYLYEFGELFRSNEVPPGDEDTNVVQASVRSTIHNQRLFVSLIYRFGRP